MAKCATLAREIEKYRTAFHSSTATTDGKNELLFIVKLGFQVLVLKMHVMLERLIKSKKVCLKKRKKKMIRNFK